MGVEGRIFHQGKEMSEGDSSSVDLYAGSLTRISSPYINIWPWRMRSLAKTARSAGFR